jgi:biotin carboxyl carrier protein
MDHGLTLNNREYDVGLWRTAEGYCLHAGGEAIPVDLNTNAAGEQLLTCRGSADKIAVAVLGDDVFIHLDGATHHMRYQHPLQRLEELNEVTSGDTIAATMPGSVVSLDVAAGQRVNTGDTLLVIESMKMETPFAAPRDGVVQAVHAGVGESFDKGAALLTLEPEE